MSTAYVLPEAIGAVIFDMDGVITDTASVHTAAWKRLFDDYLHERADRAGEPFVPFELDDYRRFVDSKPRFAGVRSFLASRAIEISEGEPTDPPDRETVCGLGNRKNELFLEHLRRYGADPYPSTVALVRQLQARGIGTAAVSASRNMSQVLDASVRRTCGWRAGRTTRIARQARPGDLHRGRAASWRGSRMCGRHRGRARRGRSGRARRIQIRRWRRSCDLRSRCHPSCVHHPNASPNAHRS
jgi:haloacid dehalogenase-like hydrolase